MVRPADPDAAWRQGRNDRYVSVRHVAALKTFERAIVARGKQAPAAIDAAQVLDGVAACRREWGVRTGALPWLRRTVLGGVAESAPADEIAARLNELDAALLRFSARANPRVEQRVGLDAARWFGAAGEALATPIETAEAPGQQFRVRCADLSAALATLRRGDAAMLENLAWRGTEGSATLARWRPEQQMQVAARDVTRRNPWAGAAGCIYFGAGDGADASASPRYFLASARSLQRRLCATTALSGVASATAASGADAAAPLPLAGEPGRNDGADDPRWMVPPSLLTLLQPLEPLRQPTGALYRLYTEGEVAGDALGRRSDAVAGANRTAIDGAALDVGYSIDVTIDPALQALAQKTAACYTGRHDICRALALHRKEDGDHAVGEQLLEGAMVRMAAVAVIDVATGRIEALAGALSPCALRGGRRPRSRQRLRRAPAVSARTTAPMRCSTRPSTTTRCPRRRSSRSWRRRSSPIRAAARVCSAPSARRCRRTACRRATACAAS